MSLCVLIYEGVGKEMGVLCFVLGFVSLKFRSFCGVGFGGIDVCFRELCWFFVRFLDVFG